MSLLNHRRCQVQSLGSLQTLVKISVAAGSLLVADSALGGRQAIAQVTPDSTLGSVVNGSAAESCLAATCTITGGTLNAAESTLLHSFSQFSLDSLVGDHSALFIDPGVRDIIVRVTGGADSFINGLVGSNPESTANLFFINPNGIAFGPNAQLDLGGAFLASTASNVMFENGIELATGQPTASNDSLLTISAPIGLGFTASSGPITVQGTGNRLVFGSPEVPEDFVNRLFQQPLPAGAFPGLPSLPPISEIAVRPGEAIALLGNGVELAGGNITAAGGQIAIGSLAEGSVLFDQNLAPAYNEVSRFADIALTQRSTLEASADSPGRVLIQGRDIAFVDSSAVLAETLPAIDVMQMDFPESPALEPPLANLSAAPPNLGGLIDIRATDTVQVSDFTAEPQIPFNPPFHSYLSVDVAPGAEEAGGLVNLQARNLTVERGGQIGANTYGEGDAGRIQLTVDEITFFGGESFLGPSSLPAVASETSSGNSGQIDIKTGQLRMEQGAQIITSSFGSGTAGSISVEANEVALVGTSAPIEIPQPDGTIETILSPTLLQSTMGDRSQGQGSNISINANQILLAEGAEIITGTFGESDAGEINIVADSIEVSGFNALEGSSLIGTAVGERATGIGGSITVDANRLQVLNGGQINPGTRGVGPSGDLIVNSESVLVSGRNEEGRSGLFATAIGDVGAGGNLIVMANTVEVDNGATLSVSNFPSTTNSPTPPGRGPAGNLQVNAQTITVRNQGLLSADTAVGDRGSITLNTDVLTLRDRSNITTNAGGEATGGNITINANNGFVVAVPEENSDITANAEFGNGGRVDITAQQIIGIQPRMAPTEESDITASSEFGVAGETRLETLDPILRDQTAQTPQSTEVPALAQGCDASNGDTASRFVQSGRGGLGTSPYGVLNNRESLADVSIPAALATPEAANGAPSQASSSRIVEAQGWTVNEQGSVTLVATSANESERCLNWRSS